MQLLGSYRSFLERDPTRTWMIPDAELAPKEAARPLDPTEALARAEMAELGTVLVFPIAAADGLLGAFAVGPRISAMPFGPHDVELLGTVAAQASIAIQNALSYRQVQGARGRLEERVLARTAELERSKADLETALKYESVGLGFARRAVNDAKESLASFREKRKGVYTGT